MDLISILKQHQAIEPFPGAEGWYFYNIKTQAWTFTYFVSQKDPDSKLLQATTRGDYPADDACELCRTLSSVPREELDGLEVPSKLAVTLPKFNALILIPPAFHKPFLPKYDILNDNTIGAFPAYYCEFSAHESRETMNALRSVIPTLDWVREVHPKVLMRYENPKTGIGSVGRKRGITSRSILMREVANLEGAEGGFIEAENYLGGEVRIEYKAGEFTINGRSYGNDAQFVASFLDEFLTRS